MAARRGKVQYTVMKGGRDQALHPIVHVKQPYSQSTMFAATRKSNSQSIGDLNFADSRTPPAVFNDSGYMYMCVCSHVCVHMCVFTCVCVCMCVCAHTCMRPTPLESRLSDGYCVRLVCQFVQIINSSCTILIRIPTIDHDEWFPKKSSGSDEPEIKSDRFSAPPPAVEVESLRGEHTWSPVLCVSCAYVALNRSECMWGSGNHLTLRTEVTSLVDWGRCVAVRTHCWQTIAREMI